MKNLYKLFTLTMGLLALSACEADRDSNPCVERTGYVRTECASFCFQQRVRP